MRFIGFYNYTVILTYMSMISAVLGMIESCKKNMTAAIICLVISGICDLYDGTVARTKKDRTEDEKMFGIQIDSLCDVISFGVFPAVLSYNLGLDGIVGQIIIACYCVCAVIRLAYYNVLEDKRQKVEEKSNKVYHGMPVTMVALILLIVYLCRNIFSHNVFAVLLHIVMAVTAFLFILDFEFKKPKIIGQDNKE